MRNETYKVHINQLVGRYFVRLTKMNELISYAYSGSNATEINFCIDLYSIKDRLLSADFICDTGVDLCSIILDMVVHYKKYFNSMGVKVNFYLINSNNLPPYNKELYSMYNSSFSIKLTAENAKYIDANYNMLDTICRYLPDIYYMHSESEVAVMIYDKFANDMRPTIVLSTDAYMFLLVGISGIAWIRPKKSGALDVSTIRMNNNIWGYLAEYLGSTDTQNVNISTDKVCIALAASKFPARCMKPIFQFRSVKKNLENNPLLSVQNILAMDPSGEMENRYKTLNIPLQVDLYRQTSSYVLNKNEAPKLYDIEGLKHLNNEYFSGNPLQLDELLR